MYYFFFQFSLFTKIATAQPDWNASQVCFCKILSVPFSTHIIFLRKKHDKYTVTASQGSIFNEKRFSTCIHNPLPFLCHSINQEMIA